MNAALNKAMSDALLKSGNVNPFHLVRGKNDIKIYASGSRPESSIRPSAGAIATVRIPDGQEQKAWEHARLLAAAPDLFLALLRLVEDAAGPHDPESWEPSRPYALAIAAIIKASGTVGRVAS